MLCLSRFCGWPFFRLLLFVAHFLVLPVALNGQSITKVDPSNLFFDGWHGAPPGGCLPGDTSRTSLITPETQVCPSSGSFIVSLVVTNGTLDVGNVYTGAWLLTGTCSDGTRLQTGPSNLAGVIQNRSAVQFSSPQGFVSINGTSGYWIYQLFGWGLPEAPQMRTAWEDHCPEGSLISGYQTWSTSANGYPILGTNCIAAGLRFQCNGSANNGSVLAPPLAPAPAPAFTTPSPTAVVLPPPPAVVPPSRSPPSTPSQTTPGTQPQTSALSPAPSQNLLPSSSAPSVGLVIGGLLAGVAAFLALATLGFCLYRRRKRALARGPLPSFEEGRKDDLQSQAALEQPVLIKRQERFTFKELQKATGNFGSANVIGTGSFGTVYKGVLADGSMIAVKRLETRPGRRKLEERSWKVEVEALGKVRHRNLVPLLGVCVERGEQLLVFEHFSQGSLNRRLHHRREGEPVLTWADRISIARGICKGLMYLHNDIRPPMVHRDIKAANVLLTNGDTVDACIADFGLAHLVQEYGGKTSTMVKGTVPYMAPEYLHGGARFLSPKCDVFSFGMLSLELISGRPAVRQLESGVVERLSKVAMNMVKEGRVLDLVDPTLGDKYDPIEAQKYINVATTCLRVDPSSRPSMEDVGSWLAHAPNKLFGFSEEDVWQSEDLPAIVGSLTSSSGAAGSTVLVASRFVTPR